MEQEQLERQEILHEFRSLLKCPGWDRLVKVAGEQIALREAKILQGEMKTSAEVNEIRVCKAERAGMKVLMMLPQSIIDSIIEEIDDVRDKE